MSFEDGPKVIRENQCRKRGVRARRGEKDGNLLRLCQTQSLEPGEQSI